MILSMRHVVVFAMFAMGLVGTVGCHGVDHTGRSGMVGRLVDASGQPISGQRISSLEAEGVTQEDGSFSVAWKDPETAVFFDRDGVHWQRAYRAEDEGKVVQIDLPETEALAVKCGTAQCDAELRWQSSTGLRARIRQVCEPGAEFQANLPKGTVEIRCEVAGAAGAWRLKRTGNSGQLVSD